MGCPPAWLPAREAAQPLLVPSTMAHVAASALRAVEEQRRRGRSGAGRTLHTAMRVGAALLHAAGAGAVQAVLPCPLGRLFSPLTWLLSLPPDQLRRSRRGGSSERGCQGGAWGLGGVAVAAGVMAAAAAALALSRAQR
jgi:hypothetical protein